MLELKHEIFQNQSRSSKWSKENIRTGLRLKCVSPQALDIVREEVAPLPSHSFIDDKFKHMDVHPGLNRPAFEYLREKTKTMSKPGENVAAVFFDEVKLDERAHYWKKTDYVLGPKKFANQIMVSSIVDDWKFHIYTLFDEEVSKKTLFTVIKCLEHIGIHVLLIVCDQGGKNLTLATELGITPTNVTFTNPADGSRVIAYSYDWVHTFKNLRYSVMKM